MSDLTGVSAVVPSLDPDEKLTEVIAGLLRQGFAEIILVDDGSREEKRHFFTDASAAHEEVVLLTHETNRGKGAALKTAFAWYLENHPEGTGVVTVDGDNQHNPEDTADCVRQMKDSGQAVLGVRDFSLPQVPFKSRYGNRITSAVFRIFCGIRLSDTQTGLRALPASVLPLLLEVSGERYEYETNMLLALKEHGIGFGERACRTIYIEENQSSHFRAVVDSWRIYKLLLVHFFRYSVSSLVSALLDEGIFALLSGLLVGVLDGFLLTAAPAVTARAVSSLCNFFMNRRLVFGSRVALGRAFLRYYALALPMLLLQLFLTHGVCVLLQIPAERTGMRAVAYAAVMTVLFVMSYCIQQRWVFADKRKESRKSSEEREGGFK